VRTLVTGWKERGLRRLAAFAAELVLELLARPAVDVLTAIPADPDRSLLRGHHPAAALSVELGRRWGLPVEPLLARTRTVERQRGLSLADRRRNVLGAFRTAARPPPRVAIVDDVYTSGATVAAAATALKKAGARHVEVVTFARALRGR
jgi:predicted amidophosphoribosyltransferase